MIDKAQIENNIKIYEAQYKQFMNIDFFPQYSFDVFTLDISKIDEDGYGAVAQAIYNPKTDTHTLRICNNFEADKFLVFHEFTHILDAEMYAKNDPLKYALISGYTEYHASQVELMVLLNAQSFNSTDLNITLNTRINVFSYLKTVEEYINAKIEIINDIVEIDKFPSNIEELKTVFGVLFNYFGLVSIINIFSNYTGQRLNFNNVSKFITKPNFELLNIFMSGFFDSSKIEMCKNFYGNMIFPIIKENNLQ